MAAAHQHMSSLLSRAAGATGAGDPEVDPDPLETDASDEGRGQDRGTAKTGEIVLEAETDDAPDRARKAATATEGVEPRSGRTTQSG